MSSKASTPTNYSKRLSTTSSKYDKSKPSPNSKDGKKFRKSTSPKNKINNPNAKSQSLKFSTYSHNVYVVEDDSHKNIDPKLLATVGDKRDSKHTPVSRRTTIQKNVELQQLLAKKAHQTVNYLTKKTHFDSEQVRALIEIFKRLTSMGKMDRLRFRETLHNSLGLTDDGMLDRIFYAFDGYNEGSVSESEWVIGLSVILRGRIEEQIAYCYEVYDVNGDHAIGREELQTCLRGCLHHIPGGEHDHFNADLDLEEGTREIVELCMKKLDLDRDGVIKYRDFHHAVQDDPLLLQAVGECLPSDRNMMSFIALFDTATRKFSTFLSHPSDPSWERENNKFDPKVAERIGRKFRLKGQHEVELKSIFKNNVSKTPE